MLRTRHVVAASSAVLLLATVSSARADGTAGSLKDAPPVAEEYVWDGLYVGIGGGAGSFDHHGEINTFKKKTLEKSQKNCQYYPYFHCTWTNWEKVGTPHIDTTSNEFGNDDWDIFGTLQIGYDRLFHKHLLIGAFADVDIYRDADNSYSGPLSHKVFADGNLDLERVWSVGGRLGFLLSPRCLIYGVGGYTEAKLDGSADIQFGHYHGLTLDAPDELKGYFVGGGGEIKLRKNISFKLEYRYADYGSESASVYESSTSDPFWCGYNKKCRITKDFGADVDIDAEIHSIRAALVVKFGDHEQPLAALK